MARATNAPTVDVKLGSFIESFGREKRLLWADSCLDRKMNDDVGLFRLSFIGQDIAS